MKQILSVSLLILAVVTIFLPSCAKAGGPATYGAKVTFSKGQTLHFPDFDLTYTGSRNVASSKYPRGFDYDDFTVSKGGTTKTVSWSSGTGLIDWADFEFGGKSYALELRISRKLGKLAKNEVVITRQ